VTHIVRNSIRVLRGLFVLRLLIAMLGIVIVAAGWAPSAIQTDAFRASSPVAVVLLIPTLIATLYVLIPGLDKRFGRLYLPIALAMTIVAFSIEYGIAYINPNMSVRVMLPSGRELNVFWASTEMILLILVPCILAGAAYGLKGALIAATFASAIHLALGVTVHLMNLSSQTFLMMFPARLAVLYAFPIITGYLADTWRHEHQAAQEANRQLRGYAAIIEHLATLRERVRLARAMHDTLAHTLSALVIQLEAIDALYETNPAAAREQMVKVRQHARTGLEETRQAIMDLRSAPVEELGLANALKQSVAKFGQRNGIQTHWSIEGNPTPLLPVQANALYRIAEEALDNVERHAAANLVTARLRYANGITLSIEDDGQGFDPATIDPKKYGLVGIYERAALVGGQVTVQAAPHQGTRLTVHLDETWNN
jgi:signal transduction histidine kinase